MRSEFINPFLSATVDVFRTMLSCELKRGPLGLKRDNTQEFEVSGLIGLSGKCQGMVAFSLGRNTAIRAAEIMLGQCPDGLNADVIDAIGEITNMIAGGAKTLLTEYQLSIGLPTVICGSSHSIKFPSGSTPLVIPFDSEFGPICVEVGLVELPLS